MKRRYREVYRINCSSQKKPNIRLDGDMLHKFSAALTDRYDLINIEDLDISISAMALSLHFRKAVMPRVEGDAHL